MYSDNKDEGIIINKRELLNGQVILSVLTAENGKLIATAFGVKKITSRRLSYLEVGNYIRFSYFKKKDFLNLKETELEYAHSKVKSDESKLHIMYLIFFVLNKILPENEPDELVFVHAKEFLRKLNNSDTVNSNEVEKFFLKLLVLLGFIDESKSESRAVDVFRYLEELIGQKIDLKLS